jgi:hypothetical protein
MAYNDEPLCVEVVGVYRKLVDIFNPSHENSGGIRRKGAV